jgi:hypothetical protein
VHNRLIEHAAGVGLQRRTVAVGLATAWAMAPLSWGAIQTAPAADRDVFLALSSWLTGRPSLDAGLANRLYELLAADDASLAGGVRGLWALVNERRIDPAKLQQVLDAEKSAYARLPRAIATAWFLGIVGEGDKARCVALESALNAAVVADVLKPPTYCHGAYASWARSPV